MAFYVMGFLEASQISMTWIKILDMSWYQK